MLNYTNEKNNALKYEQINKLNWTHICYTSSNDNHLKYRHVQNVYGLNIIGASQPFP